jgi:hypothetical protein
VCGETSNSPSTQWNEILFLSHSKQPNVQIFLRFEYKIQDTRNTCVGSFFISLVKWVIMLVCRVCQSCSKYTLKVEAPPLNKQHRNIYIDYMRQKEWVSGPWMSKWERERKFSMCEMSWGKVNLVHTHSFLIVVKLLEWSWSWSCEPYNTTSMWDQWDGRLSTGDLHIVSISSLTLLCQELSSSTTSKRPPIKRNNNQERELSTHSIHNSEETTQTQRERERMKTRMKDAATPKFLASMFHLMAIR